MPHNYLGTCKTQRCSNSCNYYSILMFISIGKTQWSRFHEAKANHPGGIEKKEMTEKKRTF